MAQKDMYYVTRKMKHVNQELTPRAVDKATAERIAEKARKLFPNDEIVISQPAGIFGGGF